MKSSSLYIRQLDGLRFFAFLAVFIHHFPVLKSSTLLSAIHSYGWVGVELFFVISSFLFFHLFDAEMDRKSKIDIPKFYMRRVLRLYPLMMTFPIAMILIFGAKDGLGWYRVLGLSLFIDNFVTWVKSYNTSIPFSGHLWTLSFEFQIYLVIPAAFLLYKKIGKGAFLALLCGIFLYGFLARLVMFGIGARHPTVWVTPFLQPESILAGIGLSAYRPKWPWVISMAISAVAAIGFFWLPVPWKSPVSSALSYPLAAVMCAGLLDSAIRSPILAKILSWEPLRALGAVSFGLYVYHLLCMHLASKMIVYFEVYDPWLLYWARFLMALSLTIVAATASYWLFEKPFLMLKDKLAIVHGRSSSIGIDSVGLAHQKGLDAFNDTRVVG